MRFIVEDPDDFIQSHWLRNVYYEQDELDKLKKYLGPGLVYLDVGANVGNHCIYFDKELKASKVYVIEPLPKAYKLLLQNVALNYCYSVNLDYLGVALSDKVARVGVTYIYPGNLGATTFAENLDGNVDCIPGDNLFANTNIDVIKIDVENMEKEVVYGLAQTIAKNKPVIFIEVRDINYDWFKQWLVDNEYGVVEVLNVYGTYTNLLVAPIERRS